MATFLMFGTYSAEALKGVSGKRTEKAVSLIKNLGGEVKSMYATLGKYDLLLIVDFPGVEQAVKASVALCKLTGVSFRTAPAVSIEQFDKIASDV